MKKLLIFSFFILFIFLVLGCIENDIDTRETEETRHPSIFITNLSVSKPLEQGSLLLNRGEQVVVRLSFNNKGGFPAINVDPLLYGCNLNINYQDIIEEVTPNQARTLVWQIATPEDFSGECTLSARLCFDYKTESRKSVHLSRDDSSAYRSVSYVSDGPIDVKFDFSDNYVIYAEKSPVTFTFNLENIGRGRLEYPGQPSKMSHLNGIELRVRDTKGILLGGDLRQWTHVTTPESEGDLKNVFYVDRFKPVSLGGDENLYFVFNKNVYDEYEDKIKDKDVDFGYYNLFLEEGEEWVLGYEYEFSQAGIESPNDKSLFFPGRGELRFLGNKLTKRATFYADREKLPQTGVSTFDVFLDMHYTYCVPAGSFRIKAV